MRQTVDATTVHGCFNLAHAERAVLEADYAVAQQLVNDGLFAVAPPKPDEEVGLRASPSPSPSPSPSLALTQTLTLTRASFASRRPRA